MMHIVREIIGWLLIIIALYFLRTAFLFVTALQEPRLFEGGILVAASLGLLRAGLLLVRLSTAARIAS